MLEMKKSECEIQPCFKMRFLTDACAHLPFQSPGHMPLYMLSHTHIQIYTIHAHEHTLNNLEKVFLLLWIAIDNILNEIPWQ